MFTSVLNKRLLDWSSKNNIVSDAQYGFKPGYGTRDAIFALNGLISKTLKSHKRLYCCFIDYKCAFDTVDRLLLWKKLGKSGITGKILTVIRSLYTHFKACIKHDQSLSEMFDVTVGLL
jgi:hypothetical protein